MLALGAGVHGRAARHRRLEGAPTAPTTSRRSTWRCRSDGAIATASSARLVTARTGTSSGTASSPSASPTTSRSSRRASRPRSETRTARSRRWRRSRPSRRARSTGCSCTAATCFSSASSTDRRARRRRRLVIGRIVAASAVEDAIRDPDRDDAELLRHLAARLLEPVALRVRRSRRIRSRFPRPSGADDGRNPGLAILDWLRERQEQMSELLDRLVMAESPSARPGLRECALSTSCRTSWRRPAA